MAALVTNEMMQRVKQAAECTVHETIKLQVSSNCPGLKYNDLRLTDTKWRLY
jgi:hypothetical protein